jgi:predicted DNA-binding transcriptional regulator YafY
MSRTASVLDTGRVLPDTTPTARTLRALELLQDRPGITAERLGSELGVTERAARRYVGLLRDAGVAVESTSGPYGGYRLGRGSRPAPLRFTPGEALALVMAVLDGHHDADDPGDPAGSALGKLLAVLPDSVAGRARAVRAGTAPAPDRAAARPDPDITTTLVAACDDRRRIRLEYCGESGRERSFEVDPWAVVVRHGRWYLLGRSITADAQRTYRVDRVRQVAVLDVRAQTPDGDPVEALEEHLALGWEYAVDVVVEAPLDVAVRFVPRSLGRLERVDDTCCRLVASTSNPDWYVQQLTAFPVGYRIDGGPEVRAAAGRIGRRLLAAAGG